MVREDWNEDNPFFLPGSQGYVVRRHSHCSQLIIVRFTHRISTIGSLMKEHEVCEDRLRKIEETKIEKAKKLIKGNRNV